MPLKISFLFPGQGSQYVGMGRDLMQAFPDAKKIFEQADAVCGRPISKLCFEGPMDELTLTVNLQPAVTAVNLTCLAALEQSGIKPVVSAGHSLGEYAALGAAGVLSHHDALALVRKRGELMHRESLENPGAMAAVLGMGIESVEEIVNEVRQKDVLGIANHNTAEQIVITGQRAPLARAVELARERGGRAIPLKVSGAWHSSLMKNAVDDFRRFMENISFSNPETPVLFNATAQSETDPEAIKDIMARQLIRPVKWYDIMRKMLQEGIDTFVEVGPGKVLAGLLKKSLPPDRRVRIYSVEDSKTLHHFLEAVS
jgi:[acyl-carrier-protein] S-malonyltransferase